MIKIITDSACDLPRDIINQYGIDLIPMSISFGDELYLDGVDLTADQFYSKLEKSESLPKTAQPTIAAFTQALESALAAYEDALVITLSSGLSGTYQSACLAKQSFSQEEQQKITVFDSLRASLGQGLLVFEAAKIASGGANREEVISYLNLLRPRLASEFTLNTLDYLIKGGRLSKIQGTIGSMLDIKPILSFNEEGKIVHRERIRGRKKSIKRLIEILGSEGNRLDQQTVAISHSRCLEEAKWLADTIQEQFSIPEVIIGEMTATIGTHTGPGCLSISFKR